LPDATLIIPAADAGVAVVATMCGVMPAPE